MSTIQSAKNQASALAHVQALIAGTQKHLPASTFTLGGTSYTAAILVPILQGLANAITAVNEAQAEKDLASAGFDVKAERARAMAHIAALESPHRRQE